MGAEMLGDFQKPRGNGERGCQSPQVSSEEHIPADGKLLT